MARAALLQSAVMALVAGLWATSLLEDPEGNKLELWEPPRV